MALAKPSCVSWHHLGFDVTKWPFTRASLPLKIGALGTSLCLQLRRPQLLRTFVQNLGRES